MKIWISLLLALPTLQAASAVKKAVDFSHTQDVGFGNEVCVLGSHPLLGGGNPLRAVKLAWTPGNVWTGRIALEAGDSLTYRYISRPFSVSTWGNSTLKTDLTGDQSVTAPNHPEPPWVRKTLLLHSTWNEAFILFRDLTHNGEWTEVPMQLAGPGRTPSEKLFRVDGLAPSGSELEFVFRNAANVYLNAPAPPSSPATGAAPSVPAPYQGLSAPYNFRTPLDVIFIQDQQVFNYRPPATVSAPRIESRVVNSSVPNIPGRPVQIYLPRGYSENTGKRYPVVYFHDGQNVFFPGGPFGVWDADRIANYETSQGRMREAILVTIPNGNSYGSDRLYEYLPDGDTITGYGGSNTSYAGRASAYLQFIIDNITPTLDTNYRTLGDAPNTFVAGSSMGGLVSDYIGQTRSDRFGGVGIFSPAYWAAPNYTATRDAAPMRPVRRFLSMGTAESSTGESSSDVYWRDALKAYNTFVRLGHPVGRDLRFEGGAGATHSESAWSRRLPGFFSFLLDPWLEAQPLSVDISQPGLDLLAVDPVSGRASLRWTARYGMKHFLETTSDLASSSWTSESTTPATELWATQLLESPATPRTFWRLRTRGW
ncbi:MAG: alpha/beta hydrolase-fold protein [Terrimicrobiaceae bacterium]